MPKSLEECRAKFPDRELWVEKFADVEIVCGWPVPDVYDDVIAGMLAAKNGGDWRKAVAAFEQLTKGCSVSHGADELDALRTRGPRYFPLFKDIGAQLLAKLQPEEEAQGKD